MQWLSEIKRMDCKRQKYLFGGEKDEEKVEDTLKK